MKISLDRVSKLVSTFRKRGNKVEEITKVTPMEQTIAEKIVADTTPVAVAVKVHTPKTFSSYIPTPHNKVDAILEAAEQDSLKREQVMVDYTKLSLSARKLMQGKDMTADNVAYAKRFTEVHTRAQSYGSEIKLADWNKGIEHVAIQMDQSDQWAKEAAQRNDAARKIQPSYDLTPYLSNVAPVYIVDQGYDLLCDNGRVYCQTDNTDDGGPVILAKLNQQKGSAMTTYSYDNPDFIDFKEYKMLLETRPSYQSIRKAYNAIRNDNVTMNFTLATKLFS